VGFWVFFAKLRLASDATVMTAVALDVRSVRWVVAVTGDD